MDILFLWNVIINNNENDDDWQIYHVREPHLKINHYFENIVLQYSVTGNDIYYLLFGFFVERNNLYIKYEMQIFCY